MNQNEQKFKNKFDSLVKLVQFAITVNYRINQRPLILHTNRNITTVENSFKQIIQNLFK